MAVDNPAQGWIATITDELNGNGYTDVQLRSLAVDSSDNIYAGGDADYWQLVVKIKTDGTVTSAPIIWCKCNNKQ